MEVKAMKRPKREKAHRWKILVVDDDEGVRSTLVDVLDLFGHEAEAVASGEEALEAFDETRHALLITDYYMPGMQGAELIQTLRRRCPSLPMIVLTGAEGGREILSSGACEILRKPFDISQMKEAVERGLKEKAATY